MIPSLFWAYRIYTKFYLLIFFEKQIHQFPIEEHQLFRLLLLLLLFFQIFVLLFIKFILIFLIIFLFCKCNFTNFITKLIDIFNNNFDINFVLNISFFNHLSSLCFTIISNIQMFFTPISIQCDSSFFNRYFWTK